MTPRAASLSPGLALISATIGVQRNVDGRAIAFPHLPAESQFAGADLRDVDQRVGSNLRTAPLGSALRYQRAEADRDAAIARAMSEGRASSEARAMRQGRASREARPPSSAEPSPGTTRAP